MKLHKYIENKSYPVTIIPNVVKWRKMPVTCNHERINALDFLRGIAVILMVQQHTGYWFWKSGGSISSLIAEHPFMVIMNGLGGLAAPIFISLAGAGTTLSYASGKKDREIFLRGIILILFGYLLNLLTPAWFAPWSWYVLHLIGLGMCLSPLLRRMNSYILFLVASFAIVATVMLLEYYSMPRYFNNAFMRGALSIPGILKLAAISGNFPVFPWIALFIAGLISGRWIKNGSYMNILKTACFIFLASTLLFIVKQGNFQLFNNSTGQRLLTVNLYMYPAYPIQFMALSACTFMLLFAIIAAGKRISIKAEDIFVLTGRASLSIFIIHIVVIRNFMTLSGFWQSFPAAVTVMLQLAVIAVIMLLVYFWNKTEFRYGFEWMLRRIK